MEAAKALLSAVVNRMIAERRLTPSAAARRLGVSQRSISALKSYERADLSMDELMSFLTVLGLNIEIRLTRRPSGGSRGKIAVDGAVVRTVVKRSRILDEVLENAEAMHRSGTINKKTMREFRALTFAEALSAMPNVGKDEDFARHQ